MEINKHSKKHKHDEKNNIDKAILQAKVELESLQTEVNTLKMKIEEQKKMLTNASLDKETLTSENLSLKKETKSLNLQIWDQQEENLKLKILVRKITEEKEKIKQQFDASLSQGKNIDIVTELGELKSIIKELRKNNFI